MKFVVVLLGNKGDTYARTRHNAGRVVFENVKDVPNSFEILTPSGFMNESGLDVVKYLRYHDNVDPVVVYDDKDLEIGRVRISYDRGDGGHNGLKSVIQCLGKTDFLRIRIGIAPSGTDGKDVLPPHGDAVQKYVLGNMNKDEIEMLKKVGDSMTSMLVTIRDEGYQKAMERYNKK